MTSVLWPVVRPSRISTVLSAPIASTAGVDLVDERHHRLLDRMGDVEPVEAELDRTGQQPLESRPVDRAAGWSTTL